MSEEKKGFTVKDRRLFTSEGELRSTDAAEPVVADLPLAAPVAPTPVVPAPVVPEAITGPRVSSPGEVDFASFVMSLAAQAGGLLDGDGPDLQGAREMISILEMLADKTEGRRSADETRVLQSLLFELRTAYVERARLASA
jgi:hypothetical protein